MQPLVELNDVTFGYGAEPVLEDICLHLHPGQFAALVGPSGAGKTSLLKLILGTLQPTRGEICIHGEALNGQPAPCVGYVPQLETVDWRFPVTVEQVVLMGRVRRSGMWPWPSAEDKERVRAVLEQLGIPDLAGRHIRDLSGGQQQRVFLARAHRRAGLARAGRADDGRRHAHRGERDAHAGGPKSAGDDDPPYHTRFERGRRPPAVGHLPQPPRHRPRCAGRCLYGRNVE